MVRSPLKEPCVPTDLYLIRHGESVANVEPIVAGMRGDAGLTDRGRDQAALLEARLRAEGLRANRLYGSTLPRAVETAEYVARALGLPVHHDDELQELRPGAADGLAVDEWRARYPAFESSVAMNPFQPFAPDGESWAGFLIRAAAALSRLVDAHEDEAVVAVTHGGVIEASFYLAFGLGATARHVAFAPSNTGITHWRHRRLPGDEREWTLVRFNDARHLDESVVEEPPEQAVPTPAEER